MSNSLRYGDILEKPALIYNKTIRIAASKLHVFANPQRIDFSRKHLISQV